MASTRKLAIAATAFAGILAGATIDRLVVQMPALFELGPNAWADYSLHADLSKKGLAFYPFVGIGHPAFSVATAVAGWKNRDAGFPAFVAAALALGGMAVTAKAAPIMLSGRHLGDDKVALQRAMRGFTFWSEIRAACQVGAFAATCGRSPRLANETRRDDRDRVLWDSASFFSCVSPRPAASRPSLDSTRSRC